MTVTTTRRSYGAAHRRMRRDWAPLVEAGGVGCWRCEKPIEPGAPWDLGHDDLDRAILRGPEHRRCNRAVKGRAPNAPASARTGSGGRLAERICEVCLGAYRPTYSAQRACGRTCGVELQRRSRPLKEKPKPSVSPVYFGTCALCSAPFAARSALRKYCNDECSVEANRRRARERYVPTAAPRPLDTYRCGHERTADNTYYTASKHWSQCRICRRAKKRAQRRGAPSGRGATLQ